jgi:hypothetical protein
MDKLIFGKANAKLKKLEPLVGRLATFSLLSGHNCPFAKDCLSKAVMGEDGKLRVVDGKHTEFRCFSASAEALFPSVYKSRKHNADVLRNCDSMVNTIVASLPNWAKCIRLHVGGDFYSLDYMSAWNTVAGMYPDIRFYAYTKSLPLWVKMLGKINDNLILTASYGGKRDDLIEKHNLRYSKVVFSEDEAKELGLEIDHDDSHAAFNGKSFALLIHGIQPAGSAASKALKALGGIGGKSSYS